MASGHFAALQKILDFMEQHLRDDIGVAEISKAVGYSPWYCNRMFKAHFGESMGTYLRSLRMREAKGDLKKGLSIRQVAYDLSFDSHEGFTKAFQRQFGISPSTYMRGGELKEPFLETYEYRTSPEVWGKGANPTPDGLWEFGYYDPASGQSGLMDWTGREFEAPFTKAAATDPFWYCRNRNSGYGMHPGRIVQAVRSFICPRSGTVEVFLSLGRLYNVSSRQAGCTVQLFHGDTPVMPREGPVLLQTQDVTFLTATVHVKKGDRLSLRLDSIGDAVSDGIFLYRQRFGYLEIKEENKV